MRTFIEVHVSVTTVKPGDKMMNKMVPAHWELRSIDFRNIHDVEQML